MPFVPGEPPRVRQSIVIDEETIQGAIDHAGQWGMVAGPVSVDDALKWTMELRREPRFEGFVVQTATRKAGEPEEGQEVQRNVWVKVVK